MCIHQTSQYSLEVLIEPEVFNNLDGSICFSLLQFFLECLIEEYTTSTILFLAYLRHC